MIKRYFGSQSAISSYQYLWMWQTGTNGTYFTEDFFVIHTILHRGNITSLCSSCNHSTNFCTWQDDTNIHIQCQKLGKISTDPALLLSFMVISDVYMAFIWNKTTFTKYFLTQWISKLPGSFEINWVSQYLVNVMGLVGIVNATVNAWQIVLIFNTAYLPFITVIQFWIRQNQIFFLSRFPV